MKRFGIYLVFAILAVVLPSAKNGDLLLFEQTSHDFGTITDSHEPITIEFEFVNTSDEPVAVLSASSSCGCTKPTYPTEPIAAGKSGKIVVKFKPRGQSGEINKDVKVRYRSAAAHGSKRITLRITGVVTPEK